MDKQSFVHPVTKVKVYEGFITHLIGEDVGLPNSTYTVVMNTLVNAGCIRQISRGGGQTPSQWELIRPINVTLFNQFYAKRGGKRERVFSQIAQSTVARITEMQSQLDAMNDMLDSLRSRVKHLEDENQSVLEWMAKDGR
jgi:hypothetical protein